MFAELEIDGSKFGSTYLDACKREQPCYNLDRRLTNILITGYSVKLRAAVIDRLDELEAKLAALPISDDDFLNRLCEARIKDQKQIAGDQEKIKHLTTAQGKISSNREASALGKLSHQKHSMLIEEELAANAKATKGFMTVTEVGLKFDETFSGQRVNKFLIELGMQEKLSYTCQKRYGRKEVNFCHAHILTADAKHYAVKAYHYSINGKNHKITVTYKWGLTIVCLIAKMLKIKEEAK